MEGKFEALGEQRLEHCAHFVSGCGGRRLGYDFEAGIGQPRGSGYLEVLDAVSKGNDFQQGGIAENKVAGSDIRSAGSGLARADGGDLESKSGGLSDCKSGYGRCGECKESETSHSLVS